MENWELTDAIKKLTQRLEKAELKIQQLEYKLAPATGKTSVCKRCTKPLVKVGDMVVDPQMIPIYQKGYCSVKCYVEAYKIKTQTHFQPKES